MPLPFPFDYKNPDYNQVFEWRVERLARLEKDSQTDPTLIPKLNYFYKYHPWQAIIDWGHTYDPRNLEKKLPAAIPFLLFPVQEEMLQFVFGNWQKQQSCGIDKSRDMGVSEAMVAFACEMCLKWEGFSVGFGSRRKDYVDNKGDQKALLYKARRYISLLPTIFNNGWNERKYSANMRINFVNSDSFITGESGDSMGRGGRTSIFVPDEFAFVEHQEMAQSAMIANTNCIVYVSTPNGPNVLYCKLATDGKLPFYLMNWRQDPRRSPEWAARRQEELDNPVMWAREYENDHYGSLEGVIIPAPWVNAAVDAHIKLNIDIKESRMAGLDIADKGADKNALGIRKHILYRYQQEFSGEPGDVMITAKKSIERCDEMDCLELYYDADGLGAFFKGDANRVNDERVRAGLRKIKINAYMGGSGVIDPEKSPFKYSGDVKDKHEKTNDDLFKNLKAQAWWCLQRRFYLTYKAVTEGYNFDPDNLISIDSAIPNLQKLKNELSQAVFIQNDKGQLIVDKAPDGVKSPNLADAMVIAYAPVNRRTGFYSDYPVN